MSDLTNQRLVSKIKGCTRIGALAENLTTGLFGFFSIKIAVPDDGIEYSLATLNGRVPETQYNTNCHGKGVGLTSGDTTYTEGTLSLTYADDYNQRQAIDPTVANNLINAFFLGGTFEYDDDTWSIIGTNGTRNIGTVADDLDHKYLFLEEGKVFQPDKKNADGTMATEANAYITAYNENNPIVCEFVYAFNSNQVKGDRMSYVLASDITFNEGSGADYNRYAVEATRYCDVKSIDRYLVDGVSYAQTLSTTTPQTLSRVNVDYVMEVAAHGDVTATLGASFVGSTLAVVETTTNKVELYILTAADTWEEIEATSTLISGALIYSNLYGTDLDTLPSTEGAGLIAIKTAGVSGEAVAITNKSDSDSAETASSFIKIYDWIYASEAFAQYGA
jgi:hypothetical protein